MQVNLSREEPVRKPGRDPIPAHVRVDGDSEDGECWIWLMFFLAHPEGGAEEPWVRVSIDEARQLRDRLDVLVKTYGVASSGI